MRQSLREVRQSGSRDDGGMEKNAGEFGKADAVAEIAQGQLAIGVSRWCVGIGSLSVWR